MIFCDVTEIGIQYFIYQVPTSAFKKNSYFFKEAVQVLQKCYSRWGLTQFVIPNKGSKNEFRNFVNNFVSHVVTFTQTSRSHRTK